MMDLSYTRMKERLKAGRGVFSDKERMHLLCHDFFRKMINDPDKKRNTPYESRKGDIQNMLKKEEEKS